MKQTDRIRVFCAFLAILLLCPMLGLTAGAETENPTVIWRSGYAMGSPLNEESERRGCIYGDAEYSVTEVFTVPEAGTRITWVDPKSTYAGMDVCILSSWKREGDEWVFDRDAAAYVGAGGSYSSQALRETKTRAGMVYSYTTSQDNEHLRLCMQAVSDEPFAVGFSVDSKTGSWKATTDRRAQIPVYEAESLLLNFPLTSEKISAEWNRGMVTPSGRIDPSVHFLYTDVITVAEKGTAVYFFDDTTEDFEKGTNFSTSALAVSVWKREGDSWIFDADGKNADGADCYQFIWGASGNLRVYRYITERDNMALRLCFRGSAPDPNEIPAPAQVQLVRPGTTLSVPAGQEFSLGQFGASNGKTIDYRLSMPGNFTDGKTYPLLISVGENTAIAEAAKQTGTCITVTTAEAGAGEVLSFAEAAVRDLRANQSFLYLVGDSALIGAVGQYFTATALPETADASSAAAELLSARPERYYDFLEGITMYALGDSYFYGSGIGTDQAWPSLLATKYHMTSVNYGRGSNTIAWCQQAVGSDYYEPMCRRYTKMENGNAQIILLEGGRNDRSQKVPIGTDSSMDENTYKGAINLTVKGLKEKNPDALIICVTPWNFRDGDTVAGGYYGTTEDYATAMMETVYAMNDPRVKCIHAADPEISLVNMNLASFRKQYSINSGDISHLNREGMRLVLSRFEVLIARYYAEYRGIDFAPFAKESDPPVKEWKPVTEEETTNASDPEDDTGFFPFPEDSDTVAITDAGTVSDTGEAPAPSGCRSVLLSGWCVAVCLLIGCMTLTAEKYVAEGKKPD